MLTEGDRHVWNQVPPPLASQPATAPTLATSIAALVLVATVAGWLITWWLGLVLAVLFLAMLVLERRGPAGARRAAGRVRHVQRRFGSWLQTGVLGFVWLLAVMPLAYTRRRAMGAGGDGWQPIGHSAPDTRRQYVSGERSGQVTSGQRSLVGRLAMGVGVLAMLVAVDVVAGSIVGRLVRPEATVDERGLLPAYADSEWAVDYWTNFSQASQWAYVPFVGWTREDVTSEFINIQDGVRQTWSAGLAEEDRLDVWMFGGSTTWGSGQRDHYTIASGLARLGAEANLPIEVTNYGESGHLIWQEVQALESALLEGGEPDLVLFYDGVNEPSRHGDRNSAAPIHSRVVIFENRLEGAPETSRQVVVSAYKNRSLAVRLLRAARGSATLSGVDAGVRFKEIPAAEALPNMMGIYSEAVELSRDIAARRDVAVAHFWQPNIYTKPAVDGENDAWTVPGYVTWDRDWYDAMYNGARSQLPDGVVDIADVFDDTAEPVMIDHTHTNELGARIVAERIFAEIEPTLRQLAAEQGL